MKKNVGGIDRIIRVVLGVVILAAGLFTQSWWGLICLVPLLTASINFCPLYAVLGFSTSK